MIRGLPFDDGHVAFLHEFGHRAWFAHPDRKIVHLTDGRHFRSRSGQEKFVGVVDIAAGDHPLDNFVTFLTKDCHDRVAGDSGEDSRGDGRCGHDSMRHEKQVFTGTLADHAVVVQQEGLVVARPQRLPLGENRVHVAANALSIWYERTLVDASPRRYLHTDTVFKTVIAQVRPPRPTCDETHRICTFRVKPHRPAPEKHERPNVALGELVFTEDLLHGLNKLFCRVLDRHPIHLGAVA